MLKRQIDRLHSTLRLFLASFILALATGLGGIFLHLLLEVAEELAFGHTEGHVSFLTDGTSGLRRFIVLLLVGLLSALVWYALQKNRPLLSIKGQMTSKSLFLNSKQHFLRQLCHIFWQILSVGAGSPIGKEGAPRELGALLASPISSALRLGVKERALLIACGAGAGLAAVYQVPLTSAFFVFETLRIKFSLRNLVVVGLSTYVSAYTARWMISAKPLYRVEAVTWHLDQIFWMLLLVLAISPLAVYFSRLTSRANRLRLKDKRVLISLPLAFTFLAFLSLSWPHLLGNGRMIAQEVLNGTSFANAIALFVLKVLIVFLVLRAGAYGGTLTPSFALGITASFLFLQLLSFIGFSVTGTSFLLIGAVAFLTITLKAPFSAVGLVYGFTGLTPESLPYLLLAAGMAFLCQKSLESRLTSTQNK